MKIYLPLVLSVLSGLAMGFAWQMPGTVNSALLGWMSALLLIYTIRTSSRPYRDIYIGGCITNAIGFYWLVRTISYFGGFGTAPAAAIFTFFVAVSSLQYLLFVLFYRNPPKLFASAAMGGASAWVASEFISIRIFPWYFGHTQLGFSWFAQIADIGGALLVSFLLLWFSESLVRGLILREKNRYLLIPLLVFLATLRYGAYRVHEFENPEGAEQKVAVVQANVSIEEKHDVHLVATNAARYEELSKKIPGPNTLIIWPESVINDFVDASISSVLADPRLPKLESGNPLLIGALTFEDREHFYNSALGILNSGTVLHPYHKQILMPFGEYTPLADVIPFIGEMNANVANFTPGNSVRVFEYPMPEGYSIKASPLICYEDVVPRLSREAALMGAELLVNITNDAWFGNTVAPYQHNLIASFRAIENRRYLVRSTNTGLTSVINPLGETISSIPSFTEGTLLASVHLMSYITLYTGFIGDALGEILAAASILSFLYQFALRKRWIK